MSGILKIFLITKYMVRSFIAIEIPEEIKNKIERVQESIEKEVKNVEKDNLHITLLFLGELENSEIEKIIEIMKEMKAKTFNVEIKGVGFFPNDKFIRIIWAGVYSNELNNLCEELSIKLNKKQKFRGHVTISRVKRKISRDTLERLNKFKNSKFGNFQVKKIVLKKSVLTPTGPKYSDLFVKGLSD